MNNMFSKNIKTIVKIEGMQCLHCANSVKSSLLSIPSVKKVSVNLSTKEVAIISKESLDENQVKDLIATLDFQVVAIKEVK